MRSVLSFALGLFVLYTGINLAARMQVFEEAKFFDRSGAVYEGRVTRNIFTGDYQIESPSGTGTGTGTGTIKIVPEEQLSGMAYAVSERMPLKSTLTMVGTVVVMLLLFGYDIFRSIRKNSEPKG